MSVAIFDSGLGGLTVYKAIRERMPNLPLVYYSDGANAPYGDRDEQDIYQLTHAATQKLWANGSDLVILACNTASAIALRRLQEGARPAGKHVLGVFVPMIEAITEREWADGSAPRTVSVQQIALFATAATVASRAFQRELAYRAIGVDVEAQPCAGLVATIEVGDMGAAKHLVGAHVQALKLRMPQPEVAVLGCTHFPLLQRYFAQALGPAVKIYSQPELVAASLDNYLFRHADRVGGDSRSRFLCSGKPASASRLASEFLGVESNFELLR